jgi:Domain of unknown function (DUF397)
LAEEQGKQPERLLRRDRRVAGRRDRRRNSRYPSGPALIYTRAEIAAFLAGAKAGEFEDLA